MSMDATRAARGPGEIRIRRAHGAVKPVRSWWTGLAGHLRPVNITPCTRPAHRWWSRPRAPPGQPPRPACRQPQRQDECGSAPRRRPGRRGAGAPAARPVAPGDAESDGPAHRRAAGPGPAADAFWCGGAAAAALVAEARAPARPHEYYSEMEFREEEAAAEAEAQTHEKARHRRGAAEFEEEARKNSDDLAGVDAGSAARRAEAAKSCAKKASETEGEEAQPPVERVGLRVARRRDEGRSPDRDAVPRFMRGHAEPEE